MKLTDIFEAENYSDEERHRQALLLRDELFGPLQSSYGKIRHPSDPTSWFNVLSDIEANRLLWPVAEIHKLVGFLFPKYKPSFRHDRNRVLYTLKKNILKVIKKRNDQMSRLNDKRAQMLRDMAKTNEEREIVRKMLDGED